MNISSIKLGLSLCTVLKISIISSWRFLSSRQSGVFLNLELSNDPLSEHPLLFRKPK